MPEVSTQYKARINAKVDRMQAMYEENYKKDHLQLAENFTTRISKWLHYPKTDSRAGNNVKKSSRHNGKIIDNTPVLALRTLATGLMNGLTPPTRNWFALRTNDSELNNNVVVKRYLEEVRDRINIVFKKANLYASLLKVYRDYGLFGQGCIGVFEDDEDLMFIQPFTVGEYYISFDHKRRATTFSRVYEKTVEQLISEFGIDNVTPKVLGMYRANQFNHVVEVKHLIQLNEDHIEGSAYVRNKKYIELYWEGSTNPSSHISHGANDSNAEGTPYVLKISGYDEFPIQTPIFDSEDEEYAQISPGMDGLGDARGLQIQEKSSLEAIEKKVRPPMVADVRMRGLRKSLLPGSVTYVDSEGASNGFAPAFNVDFKVDELEVKSQQTRDRIDQALFKDLFLLISQIDRGQLTATEIHALLQEKSFSLGGALIKLDVNLLAPLVNKAFTILEKQDLLPEPPEEAQGHEIEIEYLSFLQLAQQSSDLNSIERFLNIASVTVQLDENARNKINFSELLERFGTKVGVPASILRSEEEVQEIEAETQRQQQMIDNAEIMGQTAKATKDASQADTEGKNALTDIIKEYGRG